MLLLKLNILKFGTMIYVIYLIPASEIRFPTNFQTKKIHSLNYTSYGQFLLII